MDYKLAEKINTQMLQYARELNDLLIEIQDECENEEFKRYRFLTGEVLGRIFLDILRPLYKDFPSLEPPEFKDE